MVKSLRTLLLVAFLATASVALAQESPPIPEGAEAPLAPAPADPAGGEVAPAPASPDADAASDAVAPSPDADALPVPDRAAVPPASGVEHAAPAAPVGATGSSPVELTPYVSLEPDYDSLEIAGFVLGSIGMATAVSGGIVWAQVDGPVGPALSLSGSAMALTSAVLFFAATVEDTEAPVIVTPQVEPDGAGVSIGGRF